MPHRSMSLAGSAVIFLLVMAAGWRSVSHEPLDGGRAERDSVVSLRLLALGDINLGRTAGKRLIAGDSLFPWANVHDTLAAYDVVFANLESNISDQNGRTEDPRSNTIFTAPPIAARSLRQGGITIVSTANNHALDFGPDALAETIRHLDAAGVPHVGTAADGTSPYRPAVIARKGIRIAFFAVTELMNGEPRGWRSYVADADTSLLLPAIRAERESVDVVVVSYHGGEEYSDAPSPRTREFARSVLEGGADLFLGHHPHVPQGIEEVCGKPVVYSLGNFIFVQRPFWAQRSFGFDATLVKDSSGTRVAATRCIPLRAGYQPRFVSSGDDANLIAERIRTLSAQAVSKHTP